MHKGATPKNSNSNLIVLNTAASLDAYNQLHLLNII